MALFPETINYTGFVFAAGHGSRTANALQKNNFHNLERKNEKCRLLNFLMV